MSAHTPGEWYHVGGADKRMSPYIRAVGDLLPGTSAIAEVLRRGGNGEHEANARRRALGWLWQACDDHQWLPMTISIACLLIAISI